MEVTQPWTSTDSSSRPQCLEVSQSPKKSENCALVLELNQLNEAAPLVPAVKSTLRASALIRQQEEIVEHDPEPLDEDLYGIGITSLLRDTRRLASSEGRFCLRASRLSATSLLLIANMMLQVFLLVEFKKLVTQKAVHSMRVAYDEYHEAMYDPPFDITKHGYRRGRSENFRPERFNTMLNDDQKEVLCSCPLSQPVFAGAVLSIWTFTVVADMRKILFLIDLMCIRTPHVDSYQKMLLYRDEDRAMLLVGLTRSMQWVLFIMMFLPRMAVDIILIWLGCRWLVATTSFSDVLLNAMALEFLLVLKDLFYTALVPHRDKIETKQMLIPSNVTDGPSYLGYLGSFCWIFVVLAWVYAYLMHLQSVLPDYKWDIHSVCHDYLAEMTKV